MLDYKYVINIDKVDTKVPIPRSVLEELRKSIKGRLLESMKNEVVNCPIVDKTVSFLYCYGVCSNFVRRVKGKLYCRGLPVQINV